MASFQKALARLMDEHQKPELEKAPATAIHDELGHHLGADEATAGTTFTDLLYANSNGALDSVLAAEGVAALAASAFHFLRDKGDHPFLLRVYQPVEETHGWTTPHTVVEAILDDQPHIVDTLCEALQAMGGEIELLLNPLLDVERDADGIALAVTTPQEGRRAEQLFHAHVAELDADASLENALRRHLEQLQRVTRDTAALRERLAQRVAALATVSPEGAEAAEFLRWLGQGNFALLGYDTTPGGGDALGILQGEAGPPYHPLPDDAGPVAVIRTNARSPVRRLSYLDEIRIRGDGDTECRFVGLFDTRAYRQPAGEIPSFRRRFEQLLAILPATEIFEPNVVASMFDRLPVELIAASSTEDLLDLIRAQHVAEKTSDLQIHRHGDRFGCNAFLTVFLPRRQFAPESAAQAGALLENTVGTVLGSHVVHDDRPTVRIHFILTASAAATVPLEDLARRLRAALRSSEEGRRSATATTPAPAPEATPPQVGTESARPPAASVTPLLHEGDIEMQPIGRGRFLLRLCAAPDALVLGEALPQLQNLGLLVLRQDARDLSAAMTEHAFTVEASRGAIGDPDCLPALVETLRAVRAGNTTDDALNSLTLRAQIPWRSIVLLRTYVAYAAQIGAAPRDLAFRSLTEHSDCARALIDLAAAKFDARLPFANPAQRKREVESAAAHFANTCDQLDAPERREILRTLASLVDATVRTNAYLSETRDGPAPTIAIKIDPRALGNAAPQCRSETYVHARAYDAIVLRAGAVAQVGLALAHRLDHLRADAAARMRAGALQSCHDVTLAGSGAIFLHDNSATVRPTPAEVDRVLRDLAATLLLITDNVAGGNVVPPRDLVSYDEIDPYLVLVPGDIASGLTEAVAQVARERGYWLEDAFGAGGDDGVSGRRSDVSNAAAWECVRQHYREMGRDLSRERVDTIGIGSPAELRLSPAVHLCAAFDRHHVFIDPDPDPRETFEERQRLAHEIDAAWSDYNPRRLSRGGVILPRSGRHLQLSPEARAALHLGDADARFTGEEIVRAILRQGADLLWCASPDAAVRLSSETARPALAADPESVHVTPEELRVRVVIESGPAVFSAAARVAFARAGGHIYGPIIEGAAAASLPDREVTVKIALQAARSQRPIEDVELDQTLSQAAREIAEELSLACRGRALALGVDRARSAAAPLEFADLVAALTEEGLADRQRDALTARDDARERSVGGLPHPEIAILAALAKLRLRAAILDSSLCEDLRLKPWVEEHFPSTVRSYLGGGLESHPLRHEIAALEISRRLIDTMGATFVERACQLTGRSAAEVAKAWTAVYLIGRGEEVLAELAHERDPVRADDEVAAHLALASALECATLELLQTQAAEASLSKLVDRLDTPTAELLQNWPDRLAPGRRRAYDRRLDAFVAAGYSTGAADSLVRTAAIAPALQICDVAIRANMPRSQVCEAFLAVDQVFDIAWLEETLAGEAADSPWERGAQHALRTDVSAARRALARALLDVRAPGASVEEMVAEYCTRRAAAVERIRRHLATLAAQARPAIAGLVVVAHDLTRLAST